MSDGSVACWGTCYNVYDPAQWGGLSFYSVSVGYDHACGMMSDGSRRLLGQQ